MAKNNETPAGYVKKDSVILIVLLSVVVGFIGGVAYGVYKTGSTAPLPMRQQPMGQQVPQEADHTHDEQIAAMSKELESNPENFDGWVQLGNWYFDAGKHEKAVEAYNRALEIRPDNANVLTDLGVMYRRSGQPEKALEMFDKATVADPKHEISRFNKGIVLMHDLNDMDRAMEAWKELVEINPAAVTPSGKLVKELIGQMEKMEKK